MFFSFDLSSIYPWAKADNIGWLMEKIEFGSEIEANITSLKFLQYKNHIISSSEVIHMIDDLANTQFVYNPYAGEKCDSVDETNNCYLFHVINADANNVEAIMEVNIVNDVALEEVGTKLAELQDLMAVNVSLPNQTTLK